MTKENVTSLMAFQANEDLFHNLKVMAILKPGQKLSTKNTSLSVQDDKDIGWLTQACSRLWYNDSRQTTIRSLHTIFDSAFDLIEQTLEGMEKDGAVASTRQDYIIRFRNEMLIRKLQKAIEGSKSGLQSLLDTYKEDINTTCRILLLQEKIASLLEETVLSMKFIGQKVQPTEDVE